MTEYKEHLLNNEKVKNKMIAETRMKGTGTVFLKYPLGKWETKSIKGSIIVDYHYELFVKILDDQDKEYLMPFSSIGTIKWDIIE